MKSLISIMPIGGKDINMNFSLENAINNAVLLCDLTAPSIGRNTFERLGMTCACSGVLSYFIEQFYGFLKGGWFTSFQLSQTFLGFGGIGVEYMLIESLASYSCHQGCGR